LRLQDGRFRESGEKYTLHASIRITEPHLKVILDEEMTINEKEYFMKKTPIRS
jgi:hypothetical protein